MGRKKRILLASSIIWVLMGGEVSVCPYRGLIFTDHGSAYRALTLQLTAGGQFSLTRELSSAIR
ncbi:MAG: hypothetical protein JRI90_08475 [Deltaproteobacteria bacterium]|nr:hypothetical protein [Deltaproteobacteria bacterium]